MRPACPGLCREGSLRQGLPPAPDGLYDPTCERLLCFVLVGTPDTPVNYQDIGMGNDERQPLSRW